MNSEASLRPRTHNDYTVGWLCALPKEQTAAIAMLDHRHADLQKPPTDQNIYTLGSISNHNIVIVCLPKGKTGTDSAVTSAASMVSTFPSIKVSLLVGIGSGVPRKVRLGDVVVSAPTAQSPGVIQWGVGKTKEGCEFERTGSLNNPPAPLLKALSIIETEHELIGSKIPQFLDQFKEKWPRLASKYLRSDHHEDLIFRSDYGHIRSPFHRRTSDSDDIDGLGDIFDSEDSIDEEVCQYCDKSQLVKKRHRAMRVHYGLIASGSQAIKDGIQRDYLNRVLGGNVLCIEMEAAGLMNNFPCIVIRGICDYADSHNSSIWRGHAAAVAAAFAKELLGYIETSEVEKEYPIKDILEKGKQFMF